ncbi:DNA recombination protein RecO [Paenibacillus swuensis]|uniref:DNA repair protein RecO n=2 Tax=Paenibacillus swuensis TaxID=1178515 RepID=A0A172TPN4_9BACL|nr:DNA repair protein RecO [Paenibacillus swuensis]ANE48942.1 DNA recombination protein RecO [Paenibacillus swuensis]
MLYKVEGIVIRSMDYGEGNKIITIYSKTHGKIGIMAKGAKKLKSRHAGVSQLFTYGEFMFYKTSGLGSLNQGEILTAHHKIRGDLHLAAYAAYLVEMVDRMVEDTEASEFLFEQLKAALDAFEEGKDPQIIVRMFEMKMLHFSGVAPVLDACVHCGRDEPPFSLSPGMGGLLCRLCRLRDPRGISVTEGTVKLLNVFQQVDLRRLGNITVKHETRLQLKQCMRAYMDIHVSIPFRSLHFLDQMDKYDI